MKLRDLGVVIVYLSAHFMFAQLTDVMHLNIPRSIDILFKLSIGLIFLSYQRVATFYLIVILSLGIISRFISLASFPAVIIAGWFYLYTRKE